MSELPPYLTDDHIAWVARLQADGSAGLRVGGDDVGELQHDDVVDLQVGVDTPARETGAVLPELVALPDLLAEPDEPVRYRIDGLLPTGARAVVAAQFKAGKTTLRDNLVRALADGSPFLGGFAVEPVPPGRTVVVLDNEMSRGQLRRWLRDQHIGHPERVHVAVLRGRVATFNLLDRFVRSAWADQLREAGADVIVFDCLRPVLDALGLDESRDAGRFLVTFDAMLNEAGIGEAVVVHHMGHSGERSRGDSRIRDWPDVEWRLVRETRPGEEPDPAAPRYFSAYGRDVDVPEGALTFDPATRRLLLAGGSRKEAAARDALPAVLDTLAAAVEPLSGRAIEDRLRDAGHGRDQVRAALRLARRDGSVTTSPGPRNATLHHLSSSVRGSARECAARTEVECASAPIGARTHSHPLGEDESSARPAHSRTGCRVCGSDGGTVGLGSSGFCAPCELNGATT